MDTKHVVETKVHEHSAEKDRTRLRLGRIYALLATLFGTVATDACEVFRGFFPSLGTRTFMDAHARALHLPKITGESDDALRYRLLHASYSMRYLGTRKSLVEFMNSHFENRYTIIEMPKDAFTIGTTSGFQVATPIGSDARIMAGEGLYIWLENNTPPDVGYFIAPTIT